MVDKVLKPGIEIIQKFQGTPPEPISPQLIPCVVGPAFEVLKSKNSDGSLNDKAKQLNPYTQMPRVISPTDFPAPRGNGDELDFLESELGVDLLVGGKLKTLSRDPGEAFLSASNLATRAAFILTNAGNPADGETLVIAIDQPVPANTSADVTVTFDAVADLDDIVDQINEALGVDIASKIRFDASDAILLLSETYGAASSITIRKWGTANNTLSLDDTMNYRIEGSGYRVQDDADRDTTSPWIEVFSGNYFESADNKLPTAEDNLTVIAGDIEPILLGEDAEVAAYDVSLDDTVTGHLTNKPADIVWTGGSPHAPIRAATATTSGDLFIADGVQPGSAQIVRVEAARFKLGVVDTENSTYDSEGNPVNQVYLPLELNTMLGRPPFAPRHVWFQARNLTGSEVNTAASVLGAREGSAASAAEVVSDDIEEVVGIGHTTIFVVTVDGVERDEEVLVWTGSYDTRAEMVADFENLKAAQNVLDGVIATISGDVITFKTTLTGADQALTLKSTGTGNALLGFATDEDTSDIGADVLFIESLATMTFTPPSYAANALSAKTLTIIVHDKNGSHTQTFTTEADPDDPANLAALLAAIAADDEFLADGGVPVLTVEQSNLAVRLTAVEPNARIVATAATGNNAAFGVADTNTSGYAGLTGEVLRFKLDSNPFVYEVTFASDSLNDAVEDINERVGAVVASIAGDNSRQLAISSLMSGIASNVTVLDAIGTISSSAIADGGNAAARAFGLVDGDNTDSGTGRPTADLVVSTLLGTASIGGQIIRNRITGEPLDSSSVASGVYFNYRALRLDVSSEAADPGLLKISNFASLEADLGPISPENPLALGVYFALVTAGEGVEVSAIGVSDISGTEPEGTALAYGKCFDFLRSHEAYCIVPLSSKEEVIELADIHVKDMSEPQNRRERVLISAPKNPVRRPSSVVLNGSGNTTGTPGQFDLNDNPGSALVDAEVNPAQAIPLELTDSRQVYLEMVIDDVVRRYNVSRVSGSMVTLRSSIPASKNLDGFYTDGVFDEDLSGQDFTLGIRGAKLLIAGTTRLDKTAYAETIRDIAQEYENRRQLRLYPDTVTAVVDGSDTLIPSYHFGCAIAGLAANLPAQEAFSRRAVPGFSGVAGPKLEQAHYDIISAGNAVIEQESAGGALSIRLQATTDVRTIESREWSITKAIDAFAKLLRAGLRSRTGPYNITKSYMDESSAVIDGINKFAEEIGLVKSASCNNLVQDVDYPDTVAVDETVEVFFPANYIRVTILI